MCKTQAGPRPRVILTVKQSHQPGVVYEKDGETLYYNMIAKGLSSKAALPPPVCYQSESEAWGADEAGGRLAVSENKASGTANVWKGAGLHL